MLLNVKQVKKHIANHNKQASKDFVELLNRFFTQKLDAIITNSGPKKRLIEKDIWPGN